ncbi:MAG: HNH endonuclease [Flavobacteriaceae bacterium]|nr:HNH endonuclease [Flavobacteriaceae bacterium]
MEQYSFPEIWKTYYEEDWNENERYEFSNYGRIKSFKFDSVHGTLISGSEVNGYKTIHARRNTGKTTSRYVHKIVAQLFLDKPEKAKFVIHLDFQKHHNNVINLKWASQAELSLHHTLNPDNRFRKPKYSKLSETTVKLIKRKLADPNRKTRLKVLAKQFGVSEMQLWRIKSGENWGHVKAENV